MKTNFRLTLSVAGNKLAQVLQAVQQMSGVDIISINATNVEPGNDMSSQRQMRYAGGHRNKGISARDFVIKFAKEHPAKSFTEAQVSAAMVAHEPPFAAKSAGPVLSKLKAEGMVIKSGKDYHWVLDALQRKKAK